MFAQGKVNQKLILSYSPLCINFAISFKFQSGCPFVFPNNAENICHWKTNSRGTCCVTLNHLRSLNFHENGRNVTEKIQSFPFPKTRTCDNFCCTVHISDIFSAQQKKNEMLISEMTLRTVKIQLWLRGHGCSKNANSAEKLCISGPQEWWGAHEAKMQKIK